MPSWAVTTTEIVLAPTLRLCAALAAPEATDTPLTFTEAVVSARVGVTVTDVVAFATLAV